MARIAGVDLPRRKRVEIALTYIYGIGHTRAQEIMATAKLPGDLKTDDLTDEQARVIRARQ